MTGRPVEPPTELTSRTHTLSAKSLTDNQKTYHIGSDSAALQGQLELANSAEASSILSSVHLGVPAWHETQPPKNRGSVRKMY